MAPTKKQNVRVLEVDRLRFASGWRRLANDPVSTQADGGLRSPAVHVDIVRPQDLVVLAVDAVGCELLADGAQSAYLRPLPNVASPHLVVCFAFQHIGEEATYEGQPGECVIANPKDGSAPPQVDKTAKSDPNARPSVPVPVRAAYGSRLVFDVPRDEQIEFSTAGILAAMGRLPLRVHDLATPGDAPLRGSALEENTLPKQPGVPPRVVIGDLVGSVTAHDVTLQKAGKAELRALGVPAAGTLANTLFRTAELRRARVLLRSRVGLVETTVSSPNLPDLTRKIGKRVGRVRSGGIHSHAPKADETAIEAPYRLVISPSSEARWAHSNDPVPAEGKREHVELWHSRLGNLATRPDGSTYTDEKNGARRIIRAVWARDRDHMKDADWQDATRNQPEHSDSPFRMSLDPADRQMLVQQTAETIRAGLKVIRPVPVAAHSLWLSSLGAWLDLHGAWNTKPYSFAKPRIRSILGWDHVAPMGRDQYVRVVYPGYLFPWGHQAALVKVTERKMKDASPSTAALYQRKFLVIGEPRRVYPDAHDLPFTEVAVRPLMTPPLDDPGNAQDSYFWPAIDGQKFGFIIDALDHAGREVRLPMPLLWVAEHYGDFNKVNDTYNKSNARVVAGYGQSVAFAPSLKGGDTRLTAEQLRFIGTAVPGTSVPSMSSADVRIPAVEALSPSAKATPIAYHRVYREHGFSSSLNRGEVWAKVLVSGEPSAKPGTDDPGDTLPVMAFGAGSPSASDRVGGFLTPNVPIRGLSRVAGAVGDADGMVNQSINPSSFFDGAFPKLFGLIDLSKLVTVSSDLLRMPKVISEFIGRIEALITEVGRAGQAIADAMDEAKAMLANATEKDVADLVKQAQDALDAANSVQSYFEQLGTTMQDLLKLAGGDMDGAETAAKAFDTLATQVTQGLEDLANKLPPFIGGVLRAVASALRTFIGDATRLATDVAKYLSGIAEAGALARIRFEWKPTLSSWPPDTSPPLLEVKPDSLILAVQAQAGLKGEQSSYASAELRDFTLHLFPSAELISLKFSRFAFIAAGGKKPEVDIVFDDIGFHGVLSFVEAFRQLIPLDGFSDPPSVKVAPEGLTAGFDVALPNLAVGVFAITNLSLGADVQVPFLGKAMTVGFNFCTREKPFTLAVAFLGGGGWAGIRASAQGLEVLEIGLEAGACVAVNLGVASGSVSAMIGVYIRIESQAGSITGYFRMRGEVDVLGLISASIELYMALVYQPPTGKMVGQASITVNVSVIGISKSVTISAQRTFAGSNGDPSFMQVMAVDQTGRSAPWDAYCTAFIGEN